VQIDAAVRSFAPASAKACSVLAASHAASTELERVTASNASYLRAQQLVLALGGESRYLAGHGNDRVAVHRGAVNE
jgi:hypothetical protein